jgi:hypothetical protein
VTVNDFGEFMDSPERCIGRTRLIWKTRRHVLVSTVGIPSLTLDEPTFETMVMGDVQKLPPPLDELGELCGRYSDVETARTGHWAWCRLVALGLAARGRHTVTWQEVPPWQ